MLKAHSGLKIDEDLHVFNVNIKLKDKTYQWIHTYKTGDINKESIVLIHGYGGSSLTFYKMLKNLQQKYRVFCIDILGFGLSSRPEFDLTDPQEIIDYFTDSIDKWRQEIGLKFFHLGGHSFGGYLAGNYALKFP